MVKSMTRTALMAALLCLLCPLAFPIGVLPVTLSVFAVMVVCCLLSWRQALGAVALYLALGCIGLPVFSGFLGGIGVLLGATGGFLMSYPLMVLCIGGSRRLFACRPRLATWLGCAAALIVCYAGGVAWYCWITQTKTLAGALGVCVLPFLPWDILKMIAAVLLAGVMKKRVQ